MVSSWEEKRKRLFCIVEVGNDRDFISRSYDWINVLAIVINLAVSIAATFDAAEAAAGPVLHFVEQLTVALFGVDFILRVFTARYLYPDRSEPAAIGKYLTSFTGLVDLFSFLPYYLPFFFPAGLAAFRMFRVVRIFRLFRVNVYYDSLNVITEVIVSKKQQLISSVFIILVLMLASSLCMYSIEHDAQPEVFRNAFSGIWWSVSTLLTVGYGDIYPITPLGRAFSIVITFLGVGMVAIPTGIISAGFVDQYSRVKRLGEYGREESVRFIKVRLSENDLWRGKKLRDLDLPKGLIVAVIQRAKGVIVPKGDVVLETGDTLVLGAESFRDNQQIELKEVSLTGKNPWIGEYIQDLDISRKTIIVMIRRKGELKIPRGDMVLMEGDVLILYSQRTIREGERMLL